MQVASGCLGRAFVARAFGVAWAESPESVREVLWACNGLQGFSKIYEVFVWCLSAGFFAFFHIDGWGLRSRLKVGTARGTAFQAGIMEAPRKLAIWLRWFEFHTHLL